MGRLFLFCCICCIGFFGGGTLAEEFDGDLVFDDLVIFENMSSQNSTKGPDVNMKINFGMSKLSSTSTETGGVHINLSDSYDLKYFGFLDWSGNIGVDRTKGVSTEKSKINKIILQNSTKNLNWKVGKFTVGWGEIEGAQVLDVINTGLSVGTAGGGRDEVPGQFFLSTEIFAGTTTFSGFIGPNPDISHLKTSQVSGDNTEYGFRATQPINQGQYSLYLARLTPQFGVVDRATLTSAARPYRTVGLSAHRAAGAALLEVDLAYKTDLLRASDSDLTSHDRFDLALGVEYAVSNLTQLNTSVTAKHWLNQETSYFDTGIGGPVAASQTNASYLIGLTSSGFDGKLELSGYFGKETDASSQFVSFGVKYFLSDKLNIKTNYTRINASGSSVLFPMDGNQNLSISTEFFF